MYWILIWWYYIQSCDSLIMFHKIKIPSFEWNIDLEYIMRHWIIDHKMLFKMHGIDTTIHSKVRPKVCDYDTKHIIGISCPSICRFGNSASSLWQQRLLMEWLMRFSFLLHVFFYTSKIYLVGCNWGPH